MSTEKDTIEEIVELEWEMFDQVHNRGGRAACQDDWDTFFLMRASQLEAWDGAMRQSYLHDLQDAKAVGRNPLQDKYAYMMARTNPTEYAEICRFIPPRDPAKQPLIDEICQAHVDWLTQLHAQYPNLTGRGRPIRRSEDAPGVTSMETYLWGELETYSLHTLQLYAAYVRALQAQGQSMNRMVLENMAGRYGYASLEQAEASLSGQNE